MLPTRVLGFNLDQKTWGQFLISGVTPIPEANKILSDGLVISEKIEPHARSLVALIKSQGRREGQTKQLRRAMSDFEGQRTGLHMLFHGKNQETRKSQLLRDDRSS